MRILLVEDDVLLGEGLITGLSQDGYAVDWITDGVDADLALETERFDLVVLDWNLPGLSGLEVLRRLRARGKDTPVLLLTARDTVTDRVTGLDSGADDYLTKPFDLDELAARLRSLLRRHSGRASPLLQVGELALDPAAHHVTWKGNVVVLSPREFALLRMLMENVGRVVSKSRLEESLYGWNSDVESNTVEVFIHHLRKKFGNEVIRTVRGVGYMMDKA